MEFFPFPTPRFAKTIVFEHSLPNCLKRIQDEEIKKVSVTPKGMPPFTKPMKRGTEEQEQKGVIPPNKAARK